MTLGTSGLSSRTGSVLAYLAWWITGALMLAVERRDPTIRFHAAQALVGLGVIWLAGLAAAGAAFLLLLFSSSAFNVMLWLAIGIWCAGVVLWVICLYKAARGEPWRMPGAARVADRIV
jgi:uncharacterized membrane protein